MYGRWLRNSFIYLLILVAIVAIVFTVLQGGGPGKQEESLTKFIESAKAGEIEKVEVDNSELTYHRTGSDEITYKTEMEKGDTVRSILEDAGIEAEDFPEIDIKKPSQWGNVFGILLQFLPIIFIVAVLFFFLRHAQGSSNQALNFGKSRARMFSGSRPSVTFLDVAGVEEAKE